ncbi:hypothetical protein M1I95_05530 [Rossellomorea marisflavi]|uniref:hypothetical protein n=1 Tax=Rossellomorea marisflavi TaxID=189381 RepID=UPI0027A12A75|nr:hypothetical protein [Rossellomorea marisflavi]UTE73970.1 hypothetical protein M1I95_05530 [Rossellomorea marisflavi]
MKNPKEKRKQLIRFILLFYPIFVGTMGTITLLVLVTWLIPTQDILTQLPAIILVALVIYVPCIASLIIRAVFFKKDSRPEA